MLAPQDHRIQRPRERRDSDAQIADVEIERDEPGKLGLQDDDSHTDEGDDDAGNLAQFRPDAAKGPFQQHDHHRRGGVDQRGVGRRGALQRQVDESAAQHHAEEAKRQQFAQVRAQLRPVPAQAGPCKRQHDREGDQPAPERQRRRHHRLARRLADDEVGGKEQRRGTQHRVGHPGGMFAVRVAGCLADCVRLRHLPVPPVLPSPLGSSLLARRLWRAGQAGLAHAGPAPARQSTARLGSARRGVRALRG